MTETNHASSVFIRVHPWLKRPLLFALALSFSVAGLTWAAGLKILKDVPSTYVYPPDGFIPWNLHRVTNTMVALMMGGATFNDPQGVACALLDVHKDAQNPENDIVVTIIGVNSGSGEILYNIGLRDVKRFGSKGSGEKQFLDPVGSAIHPDGTVAVADTGNHRIALLKHDGMRLKWTGAVGKQGKGLGEFQGPRGVALDTRGNLYIADTGNDRIQVRDPSGKFRVLKTPPLEKPWALAVTDGKNPWAYHKDGRYADRLAVIDRDGTRLRTFTLSGEPLNEVSAAGIPEPPVRLWACAFDYYGNVVATDHEGSRIRKFDKELRYITAFGTRGQDDYQFLEPRGIAVHQQFGQVIVAERKSAQYLWVGADAVDLSVRQEGPKVRVKFFLTERAYVTAAITSSGGTPIHAFADKQDLTEGPHEFIWAPEPGRNPGDHYFKMRVMATYSSRERIAKDFEVRFSYVK